ncbi:MAG: hypothetical protein JWM78_2489 [Verrucomicrobiaceae bacterium]|nr:hypothetical protein [Verrucomicrobiaceae bacterium]
MLLKPTVKLFCAAALCAPLLAQADVGIYAKGGTLGFGGGVGIGITDSINARLGYTTYNFDKDISDTDVDYKAKFKLGGAEALLDWHPFNGSFRVTGGVVFSRNKIDVDAKLDQTVTINDHAYLASDFGKLNGEVKFKSTVPYVGIGWGNVVGKQGNFHFVADIGVEFQGSPDVKLHGSCTTAYAAQDPVNCAKLVGDVAAEEKDLNDKVSDYKWWPVLNLGVAYRF